MVLALALSACVKDDALLTPQELPKSPTIVTEDALNNALEPINERLTQLGDLANKNEAELNSTRQAHLQDGAAMVKFLYWLKNNVASGTLNEVNIAEFLAEKRYEMGAYDLSFDTIAAYLDHGAMMHYSATEESDYKRYHVKELLGISEGEFEKIYDSMEDWSYEHLRMTLYLHYFFSQAQEEEKGSSHVDYSPVSIMYCKLLESLLKEHHRIAYAKTFTISDKKSHRYTYYII